LLTTWWQNKGWYWSCKATKGQEVKIAIVVIDQDGMEHMISRTMGCWPVGVEEYSGWIRRRVLRMAVYRVNENLMVKIL
jgi:hypothetical protein